MRPLSVAASVRQYTGWQLKRAALDHVLTCAQPMSRRGRPKTKCGECAVCRNSKSKKKCGPTHLAPQSQDGFPSFYSVALRSCLSRSLSLSRVWSTPPAPPQRRSLPHPPQPNAPLLQVHRGGSTRAGAAEAAQGGSAVSRLAWPRICAAKARRNRHGFAVCCRAVQRQPQAQVVPQGVGSARQSRRRDVRRSPVRVWQGERLLQRNPHLFSGGTMLPPAKSVHCALADSFIPTNTFLGRAQAPGIRTTWLSPCPPRLSLPSPLAACACQVVQAVPRCSLQALAGVTTAELLRARTAARKAANKRRLQASQASPTAADAPSCTPVPPEETWSHLTVTGRHRLTADPDYDGSARNGISKSAGGPQSPVRNGINKSAGGRQLPVYFATATPAAERSTQPTSLASFKRAVLEVETASGTVFTRRIYNRRHPPWPVCGCSKCTNARVGNPAAACPNGGVDGYCCYTPPARRRCPRTCFFGELWPSCPFTPRNDGKFLDRWSNVVDCGCVAFPPPTPLLIRCDDGVDAKTAAFNRGCTHWILCRGLLRCGTRDTGLCKACRSALDEQKVQK